MITIHTTAADSVEAIEARIQTALEAKYLRETRQPVPNPLGNGPRLSGETIYHLAKEE